MNAMGGSKSGTNHGSHADILNRTNENPTSNGADGEHNEVQVCDDVPENEGQKHLDEKGAETEKEEEEEVEASSDISPPPGENGNFIQEVCQPTWATAEDGSEEIRGTVETDAQFASSSAIHEHVEKNNVDAGVIFDVEDGEGVVFDVEEGEGEEVIITGGDHVEVDVGDEHPHYTIMHHDDTMVENQALEGHPHDNKIEHIVVVDHQEEEALHHAEEILISDNNDGHSHSHGDYAYGQVTQDDNDNQIHNSENMIDHQHQIEQLQEQDGELQAENGPETLMVVDNTSTVAGELHHDAIKYAHKVVMETHENNEAVNFENQHSINEPISNAKTEAMDGNNAMMGRDSSVEYYHQDTEERVVVTEELQHSQYQQHEEHQSDQRYQGHSQDHRYYDDDANENAELLLAITNAPAGQMHQGHDNANNHGREHDDQVLDGQVLQVYHDAETTILSHNGTEHHTAEQHHAANQHVAEQYPQQPDVRSQSSSLTKPSTSATQVVSTKRGGQNGFSAKDKAWNEMLQRLEVFKAEHNHTLVPKRYAKDPKLGTWVETQRVQFRKMWKKTGQSEDLLMSTGARPHGTESTSIDVADIFDPTTHVTPNSRLSVYRLAKLRDAGFAWSVRTRKSKSANIIDCNSNMSENQGHNSNHTSNFVSSDSTRSKKRKQNESHEAVEHNVGYVEEPLPSLPLHSALPRHLPKKSKKNEMQWDEMLKHLAQYKAAHGGCIDINDYSAYPELADWADTVRYLYMKHRSNTSVFANPQGEIVVNQNSEGIVINRNLHDAQTDNEKVALDRYWTKDEVLAAAAVEVAAGSSLENMAIEENISPNEVGDVNQDLTENEVPNDNQCAEIAMNIHQVVMAANDSNGDHQSIINNYVENGETNIEEFDRANEPASEFAPLDENIAHEEEGRVYQHQTIEDITNNHQTAYPSSAIDVESSHAELQQAFHYHADQRDRQENTGLAQEDSDTMMGLEAGHNNSNNEGIESFSIVNETAVLEETSAGDGSDEPLQSSKIITVGQGAISEISGIWLSKERKEQLDEIGFDWLIREDWDEMFAALEEFKTNNGNCLVPPPSTFNSRLSRWVEMMRSEYLSFLVSTNTDIEARGNSDILTPERILRMEALGFEWITKSQMKDELSLETNYALANNNLAGLADEGTNIIWSPGGIRFDAESDTLGGINNILHAANSQTNAKKKSSAEPSKSFTRKQRRSQKAGTDKLWFKMFDQLKGYAAIHGHCKVPKRDEDYKKLGTWVDTQRSQYKKRQKLFQLGGEEAVRDFRITNERIEHLNSIGFAWGMRDDWNTHFEELVQYKEQNGHCHVPARYANNTKLGTWVISQRQQYRNLKEAEMGAPIIRSIALTKERIKLLEDIGFYWSVRSRDNEHQDWEKRYMELCVYKSEYGHCNVPSRHEENPKLAAWCLAQRSLYRQFMKAKEENVDTAEIAINEDRIRRLEEIDFNFSVRSPEATWKKRLEELHAFKLTYGADYAVPSKFKENPRLGVFAQTHRVQRTLYEQGKPSLLDKQKIAELDAIDFCWNVEEVEEGEGQNAMDEHHMVEEGQVHEMEMSNQPDIIDHHSNNGEEIMDEHVIHNPHDVMYEQTMVEMDNLHETQVMNEEYIMNEDHQHPDDANIHTEGISNHAQEQHYQSTEHMGYDENALSLAMDNEETDDFHHQHQENQHQDQYENMAHQAGAISMAADIAAAAVHQNAVRTSASVEIKGSLHIDQDQRDNEVHDHEESEVAV